MKWKEEMFQSRSRDAAGPTSQATPMEIREGKDVLFFSRPTLHAILRCHLAFSTRENLSVAAEKLSLRAKDREEQESDVKGIKLPKVITATAGTLHG